MRDDVDDGTALALGLVETVAARESAVAVEVLAGLDADELRALAVRLAGLVRLRGDVGRDQPSTAAWCAWLRAQAPGLVI